MNGTRERGPLLLVVAHEGRRSIMEAVLSDAGYQVESVAGVGQAVDRLRADPPVAIVTDVMPGTENAFDLLHAVRDRDDGPVADLPVVISTGRNRDVDRIRAWELGCDGFVPRPHYMAELVVVLDEVLALSPPQRARRREELFHEVRRQVAEQRDDRRR